MNQFRVLSTFVGICVLSNPVLADGHDTPNVAAASFDWSGSYVGLRLSASGADGMAERSLASGFVVETDVNNGLFPDHISDWDFKTSGSASVGYNVQRGNNVGGIEFSYYSSVQESDLGFSRVDPEILAGVDTITRYQTEIDNLLSLRFRGGYVADETLYFAAVGLARGDVRNAFTLDLTGASIPQLDFEERNTLWGYTVGLGVETPLSDRVSLLGEVTYYDLADQVVQARAPTVFPGNELDYTFHNSGLMLTIGINFSF